MAFRHGVYKSEVPTSLIPPVHTEAGLPVFVGTAPIHIAKGGAGNVNKPQLVYNYAEAVELFGYSDDWKSYTLCEAIYSQFALFNVSPCVLINVLDPETHSAELTEQKVSVKDKTAKIEGEVLPDTVVIQGGTLGTDYELSLDAVGGLVVNVLEDGALAAADELTVTYSYLNPALVTEEDIIGGVDAHTGAYTGLELVNSVFPKFRLVPGLIAAPGWSDRPDVAAVMRAKAENVSGFFTANAVVDIPSGVDAVSTYANVPEWKNKNNYMAERQIVCWPKVKLGNDVFHLSTQLVGLMNKTDAGNDDIPYESPSNKLLQMTGMVNGAGMEINLGPEQANYLNGQGIVTALNWVGGWRAWGNRTGAYPANTDPKDAFIPIRRMFDWIGNEFILSFWQKVDKPMTPRLIRTIVNSFNVRLNGLAAREYILGGRVEFMETENAMTDLLDGILRFHIYLTPPPPAEQIEGILEYDPTYFNSLFEAVKG